MYTHTYFLHNAWLLDSSPVFQHWLWGPDPAEAVTKTRPPEVSSANKRKSLGFVMWEFPKIRGTLSWGPCNKDPTM